MNELTCQEAAFSAKPHPQLWRSLIFFYVQFFKVLYFNNQFIMRENKRLRIVIPIDFSFFFQLDSMYYGLIFRLRKMSVWFT